MSDPLHPPPSPHGRSMWCSIATFIRSRAFSSAVDKDKLLGCLQVVLLKVRFLNAIGARALFFIERTAMITDTAEEKHCTSGARVPCRCSC
jgi:hypothetical protein